MCVSIELCTLHLQETYELEQMMPFLLFADGCAAALISAEPKGLSMERFHAAMLPEAASQMAWHIRDLGFDMVLSSRIPTSVGEAIQRASDAILAGLKPKDIELWAVHPGGRAVLDAVEARFRLPLTALDRLAARASRLRQHVVGDGAVRAEIAARGEQVRSAGLRHVLRPGPHGGNDAVQGRLRSGSCPISPSGTRSPS